MNYQEYRKLNGRLEKDEFDKLVLFSSQILKSIVSAKIPSYRLKDVDYSVFNEELVMIIAQVYFKGGLDYFENQDNLIDKVSTQGFSYSLAKNEYGNMPVHTLIINGIDYKIRMKGYNYCGL